MNTSNLWNILWPPFSVDQLTTIHPDPFLSQVVLLNTSSVFKWALSALLLFSDPYWKNRCFQRWKWNAFSLMLPYFFANSENATKSKFSQETLNVLSALKFAGSHLAFYERKVSFSLISRRIFSLGTVLNHPLWSCQSRLIFVALSWAYLTLANFQYGCSPIYDTSFVFECISYRKWAAPTRIQTSSFKYL